MVATRVRVQSVLAATSRDAWAIRLEDDPLQVGKRLHRHTPCGRRKRVDDIFDASGAEVRPMLCTAHVIVAEKDATRLQLGPPQQAVGHDTGNAATV